jgi:hypothetical protein
MVKCPIFSTGEYSMNRSKNQESGLEQRSQIRYLVNIDLTVQFLDEKRQAAGSKMDGKTMNVSRSGMGLKLDEVSREKHEEILSGAHFAQVRFLAPVLDDWIELIGSISWQDSHEMEGKDSTGLSCYAGIQFEPQQEDQDDYDGFIKNFQVT